MFSTAQMDMLRPLIIQMRDNGYLYYLAYQNYTSTSNDYDLFVVFSKEVITAEDMYTYAVPADSLRYSIRSGNAYSSQTTPRITTATLPIATTVTIEEYQHISTNAEFQTAVIQPDIFISEVKDYDTQGSLLLIVCSMLCVYCFFKLFRR